VSRNNVKFGTRNEFEVGSQPPDGYIAKQEWAHAQLRGGLKQRQCKVCKLWKFPQETCSHAAPANAKGEWHGA
jgi:hypothetical protein